MFIGIKQPDSIKGLENYVHRLCKIPIDKIRGKKARTTINKDIQWLTSRNTWRITNSKNM